MDKVKSLIIGILTAISSLLGVLYIPVLMLVISNIIDYLTGLFAAKYRGNVIDSNIGFKGIVKKVNMWILVCVVALVDNLLLYVQNYLGFDFKINFLIASLVAVWLLVNELISILENISDMGVPVPSFLMPLIKNIKSQIDKKAGGDSDE